MSLHIEISGDASRTEWEAVAALAAVMLGTTAITSGTVSISSDVLGIDADRPRANIHGIGPDEAGGLNPDYVAPVVDNVPPPPPAVDNVPPPPSETLPSETLMSAAATHAAAAVAAGADLDANGLPHDLRIHASTKTKKADGTWTLKRGVASTPDGKALVTQVEAELRKIMAAGGAPIDAPLPVNTVPPPPATLDPAAAFGTPPANGETIPPPPTETVPPAPEPSPTETPFARVMRTVVARQAAKTLSTEMTTQLIQSLGLTSIRDLSARPDLIPQFEALL